MRLKPRFSPNYGWAECRAAFSPSRGMVEKYEQAFARKFGCSFGVMFSYGRVGLYALFKVWGINKAEIICPAYTCVVVPHAIVLSENIPVFIDCAPGSFNMDLEKVQSALNPRTRAVIATHLFGYPMDVERLRQMVTKAEERYGHKIFVIQDVAHCFGARWKGELVTTWGDASIFGCNISKIINSIFGGIVTTNDEHTYEILREYRGRNSRDGGRMKSLRRLFYFLAVLIAFKPSVFGFINLLERKGYLDRFVKYYNEALIEFPSDWDLLPSEIEARIGMVQLEKYDNLISQRIGNAQAYIQQFIGRDNISVLPFYEGATYSHFVALVQDRKAWLNSYRIQGIQLGALIDYVIPSMKAYQKFSKESFPVAQDYSSHIINFPLT